MIEYVPNGSSMTRSSFLGGERRQGEGSETAPSDAPKNGAPHDPEVRAISSRRRFTSEYKERILREAEACRGTGQIGAMLRREGLYSSHLGAWKKQLAVAPKRRGRKPMDAALVQTMEENRKLKLEKARLERRLARAETIIDIQKKVSALLGIPLSPSENDGSE